MLALSQGERDQGTKVNEKEAKEDAKNLFKVKVVWGLHFVADRYNYIVAQKK